MGGTYSRMRCNTSSGNMGGEWRRQVGRAAEGGGGVCACWGGSGRGGGAAEEVACA